MSYYKTSRRGVNLGRANPGCKYLGLDDNFFKNIDTEEKAYVLGFIASDGSISNQARIISIALSEVDKDILEKIKHVIYDGLLIKPQKVYGKNNKKQCRICICSKTIGEDVCKILGISSGKKSATVKFPKLPADFVWGFIRGYFDGDGNIRSIDRNPKKGLECGISSNSEFIKSGIKNICDRSAIYCHVNKYGVYFSTRNAISFLSIIPIFTFIM